MAKGTRSVPAVSAAWAEAYRQGGRPKEGLGVLAQVLDAVDEYQVRHSAAEIYRMKGERCLKADFGRRN